MRCAFMSLILLAACKSDSQKLSDELDRSSSWQATIAAIDSARALNRIPSRYADDARADARDELAKSSRKIAELREKGVKPKQ